jgi:hypothetical protein
MTDEIDHVVAFGRCWICRRTFSFHPERVTSVLIDPLSGKPPDLGGDPGRARREPVCPSCCVRVNIERRDRGLPLLDERDSLA